MARSLGDYVAQSVGVIPDPEILVYEMTLEDRFVVIASDGVWEFLSNEQVAQLVLPFYLKGQAELAANQVVKEATKEWK
jgi:serine/threonine protein phosphatase PrpC